MNDTHDDPGNPGLASESRPARRKRASFGEAFSFSALSVVSGGVIGFASTIIVARLYGISVIGEFALASAPTATVSYLSTVAERPALIRALAVLKARDPRVTGLFFAVFVFSLLLTLVAVAIGVAATYLLFNGPIDQPDLIAPALVNLVGYLAFSNAGWNFDAILVAFRAGRELFWVRFQQVVAFLVFALIASFIATSVWCLIAATIASTFTALLQRLVYVRPWMRFRVPSHYYREGFQALPGIIRFGLKLAPGKFAQGGSAMAGTWILGVVASVPTVGAWNRAWTLGSRFLNLQSRISEIVLPTLVERDAEGDARGFDRALIDSLRYVAVLFFLPAAVGGGAATGVMELFGPGFSQASDALALILLVPTLSLMTMLQMQALISVDRPVLVSGLCILRLLVTLGTAIPLTLALGLTGAALGTVLGCVVLLLVQSKYVSAHLAGPVHRFWPYRHMAAVALAYASGFAVARVLDAALGGVVGLAAALAAGSVAYLGALAFSGGILPRDARRLAGPLERAAARMRLSGLASRALRVSARRP